MARGAAVKFTEALERIVTAPSDEDLAALTAPMSAPFAGGKSIADIGDVDAMLRAVADLARTKETTL